jgi:hypothetical protein
MRDRYEFVTLYALVGVLTVHAEHFNRWERHVIYLEASIIQISCFWKILAFTAITSKAKHASKLSMKVAILQKITFTGKNTHSLETILVTILLSWL